MKKFLKIAVLPALVIGLWIFLGDPSTGRRFDRERWVGTSQFYMVYDIDVPMDFAEGLSRGKMRRISRERTGMAYGLVESGELTGLTREQLTAMLGSYRKGPSGPDGDTVRYVIDAAIRPFQMYGESGRIYKELYILLVNDRVTDVWIYDRYAKDRR